MPAKKLTTERAGRRLAARMLREMEAYETKPGSVDSLWPWSIQAVYRPPGSQQDNVLLRYLDAMQGNHAELVGFCAVVTRIPRAAAMAAGRTGMAQRAAERVGTGAAPDSIMGRAAPRRRSRERASL